MVVQSTNTTYVLTFENDPISQTVTAMINAFFLVIYHKYMYIVAQPLDVRIMWCEISCGSSHGLVDLVVFQGHLFSFVFR